MAGMKKKVSGTAQPKGSHRMRNTPALAMATATTVRPSRVNVETTAALKSATKLADGRDRAEAQP